MDKQAMIIRLMTDFGYSARGAYMIWERIDHLAPAIAAPFSQWWEDQILPQINIGGYTIQRLMTEHGMKPVAAFLTLDWLLREPAVALASLKKGHDQILFDEV